VAAASNMLRRGGAGLRLRPKAAKEAGTTEEAVGRSTP
jgi:hypothetical protein